MSNRRVDLFRRRRSRGRTRKRALRHFPKGWVLGCFSGLTRTNGGKLQDAKSFSGTQGKPTQLLHITGRAANIWSATHRTIKLFFSLQRALEYAIAFVRDSRVPDGVAGLAGLLTLAVGRAEAQAPDFPPFDKVTEGYTKLDPPRDEPRSMYETYVRQKDSQLLFELPKNYAEKKYFIGLTVASGQVFAGLQAGDFFVQWRQYNNRLALIAPNLEIRAVKGDTESQDSVNRLFTGSVLLDLPIITMSPRGGPVIDGDALLVGNASVFFGARRTIR